VQIASRINNYLVIVYNMLRICKAGIKFASNARWHFVSRLRVFLPRYTSRSIFPQICAIVFPRFVTDLTFHLTERKKINSACSLLKVKCDDRRPVFIIAFLLKNSLNSKSRDMVASLAKYFS